MQDNKPTLSKPANLRQLMLLIGEFVCHRCEIGCAPVTDVKIMQSWVRVIAPKNLMIDTLGESTRQRPGLALAMAALIAQSPGSTPHLMITRAAAQMITSLNGRSFPWQGATRLC
jgi:hypothetical protein